MASTRGRAATWTDYLRPRSCASSPAARGGHLGNHTCSHPVLTNCSAKEVEAQITGCQKALDRLVVYRPIVMAYPHGLT
jgi:peptidoglycan/xylan/chitin deacetylase (PgdA/CDA1 family)